MKIQVKSKILPDKSKNDKKLKTGSSPYNYLRQNDPSLEDLEKNILKKKCWFWAISRFVKSFFKRFCLKRQKNIFYVFWILPLRIEWFIGFLTKLEKMMRTHSGNELLKVFFLWKKHDFFSNTLQNKHVYFDEFNIFLKNTLRNTHIFFFMKEHFFEITYTNKNIFLQESH